MSNLTHSKSSSKRLLNHPPDGRSASSRFDRMLGSNVLSELKMVNPEMIEGLKSSEGLSSSSVAKLAGYSDTSVLPRFLPESLPSSVLVHILNYQTFTLLFLNASKSKLERGTECVELFETTANLLRLEREKIQEKIEEGVMKNGEKFEYVLDDFGNIAINGCCMRKDKDTVIIHFGLMFSDEELRIREGEKGSKFGIPYYKLSLPDTSLSFLDYAGMIRGLDMRHQTVREELRESGSLVITHKTTGAFLTVYNAEDETKQSEWTLKRYFGYFGAVQTLAWCWLVEFYQKYDCQRRKLLCPDPGWKSILIKNSIEEAYGLLHYARPRISANWSVHPESCVPFLANVAFKQTVSVLYKANLALPVGETGRDIYFINYYTEVGMPCPKFLCASNPQKAYPQQWIECISSSILATLQQLGIAIRQKDKSREITVLGDIILIDKEQIIEWLKDGKNAKLYAESTYKCKKSKPSRHKSKNSSTCVKFEDSKRKRKKIKRLAKIRNL